MDLMYLNIQISNVVLRKVYSVSITPSKYINKLNYDN